jgi:hypothetical protein
VHPHHYFRPTDKQLGNDQGSKKSTEIENENLPLNEMVDQLQIMVGSGS